VARTDPALHIRLPAKILESIRASAADNGRSMNAEVVARLSGNPQRADPFAMNLRVAKLEATVDQIMKVVGGGK
jgi:hypothetical protein